ncbi:S8 family peptidase [Actinacidiphila sp. bgisy160]|uniref:S8 family peptidase n=1 Tax=Actinacidiphila sp. bgisy160 TaxID=3413796 RepID=UPI003D7326B3
MTVGLTILGMVTSATATQAAEPTRQAPRPGVVQTKKSTVIDNDDLARTLSGSGTTVPVTLITGDKVNATVDAHGKPAVRDIESAARPDGSPVVFHTITRMGKVYVVPNDALALIGNGVLDWGLFDLSELVALAAAGKTGEVPVLVTYTGQTGAQRAAKVAGAAVGRTLTSINGRSMEIAGDGRWWRGVRGKTESGAAAARSAGSLAGVRKVWLNGLAEVSLDTSVPQIGAPVAWDRGYDGKGVSVAVLDTGIDADHPDVSGHIVEKVDFTGSPSGPRDGHGHGTHVASTILGTGAASNGQRKGVAPGADLRVGKVCDDNGQCTDDAVIAGMEWAAHSGAKVVNMSLGGDPSDGTDPLSQSLDELSRDTGTLFVVAAGNSGPGKGTVGSPGAADEALTVAAVDKQDRMADFSSRGPRVGDGAAKPDIAAPGVDIVAARAAGTAMGTTVDEYYTTASGTSMATPHVAGAAALIAQQHPDLSGREIKALLMSTAKDLGFDRDAQGAGRVDVAAATDPRTTVNGNLGFGRLAYPHAPLTRKVTYTNHTDEPTTLHLTASVSSAGKPAPAGLVTLDTDEVVVPAGGSADVSLTLDGRVLGTDGAFGGYSGLLDARDPSGALRAATPVTAFLEPQKLPLTVNVIRPPGATDVQYGFATFLPVDGDDIPGLGKDAAGKTGADTITLPLFRGTYSATVPLKWRDADGAWQQAAPLVAEVDLTEPATVTLDLRELKPLRVRFPQATEVYEMTDYTRRVSANGARSMATLLTAGYGDEPNWWALPTGKVRTGTLVQDTYSVRTTPVVTMRATGGGAPIRLTPRYRTPDVSLIGSQMWLDDDGNTVYREVSVPISRLPLKGRVPVVYAGTGSDAELAAVNARGKLVLLTPTDVCDTTCDFPKLRDERVAAAASAGAVGVLVAAPELTSLGGSADFAVCTDGPKSCPAVQPYAALPVVKVPYAEADRLIKRIKADRSNVEIELGGSAAPSTYAARFHSDGRIPSALDHRVGKDELDRVDHYFHADRPGEVTRMYWWQQSEAAPGALGDPLPHVATQRTMTTFIKRQPDAIDQFFTAWADHGADSVLDQARGERREMVLTGKDEVHWNEGPAVPGAVPQVRTRSGYTLATATPCSGCRQGDTFYPTFQLTSSGGARQAVAGIVDNDNLAEFLFGASACGPTASPTLPTLGSTCDFKLLDQSGDEVERRLQRLHAGIFESRR